MTDARPGEGGGQHRKWLIGLLLVALVIRLAWGVTRPADEAGLAVLPDQREYLELARNLLAGEGLKFRDERFGTEVLAFRMPGYPAFLAACGGNVRIARAAQAFIDTSTVLAAYLLARRWLTARQSLLAGLFVAFNPFLVYFSGLILSETPATSMLAWGMVLLVWPGTKLDRWVPGLTWVAGLLVLALSIHVRPSGIGLPLVLGLASVFANRTAHAAYQRRWPLPVGATALLLTLLVLTPWAVRNYYRLGTWVWTTTNSGFTAYDGFNPDATGASDQSFVALMPHLNDMTEVERSRYLAERAREFALEYPRNIVALSAQKVARTWSPMPLSDDFARPLYVAAALAFALPFDVLVVVGLFAANRSGRSPQSHRDDDTDGRTDTPSLPTAAKVFLLVPALYLTAVHAASVGSLRYRVPAEVPMAVLAARGLSIVWMNVRRRDADHDDDDEGVKREDVKREEGDAALADDPSRFTPSRFTS